MPDVDVEQDEQEKEQIDPVKLFLRAARGGGGDDESGSSDLYTRAANGPRIAPMAKPDNLDTPQDQQAEASARRTVGDIGAFEGGAKGVALGQSAAIGNAYRDDSVKPSGAAPTGTPTKIPMMGRAYADAASFATKATDNASSDPGTVNIQDKLAMPEIGNAYRQPSDAARSLGEFSAATGANPTPAAPGDSTPKKPSVLKANLDTGKTHMGHVEQVAPPPQAPTMSPDYAATQADLRAKSGVTPKYDPQTGKVLDKYHEGVLGRIGRAFLDFGTGTLEHGLAGGIDKTLHGAFSNENSPDNFGRGAVNNQYFRDERQRQQDVAADTDKIKSFEAENTRGRDQFKDQNEQWKDTMGQAYKEDLSDARAENADTRRQLEQTRANQIDPNSIEKNDKSETGFYGYAAGDKDHSNPIPITPKGMQKAETQPKSYEQQVLAWSQATDPKEKAALEQSIKHIEQQRQAIHKLRAAKLPDVDGLTAGQNRNFRAQLVAEGIAPRRAALQSALKIAAPKDRSGIQKQIDSLDERSQEILKSIKSPNGANAPNGKSDMVRVQKPDGTPGTIPRSNLKKAVSRGYKALDE